MNAEAPPARVRRERMLAMLRERDFVRVSELATRFEVSEVTVRSDLGVLERRGALRRVRGGAVPRAASSIERPFEEAEARAALEKRAIGYAAAQLVDSWDTIILDVGSTTTAMAQALAARQDLGEVTVFTSSLTIALALEAAHPRLSVVVTGGTLRPKQHSLVEPLASFVLHSIHASKLFLGCNGIDVEAGVTNVNLPETEIKRQMVSASQQRILCADSTKIGQVALAHVCPLDDIDVLVTDDGANRDQVDALCAAGIDVQLAPPRP